VTHAVQRGIWVTTRHFALELWRTTENLDRVGLSQDLPALNTRALTSVPVTRRSVLFSVALQGTPKTSGSSTEAISSRQHSSLSDKQSAGLIVLLCFDGGSDTRRGRSLLLCSSLHYRHNLQMFTCRLHLEGRGVYDFSGTALCCRVGAYRRFGGS
jgi:hypothetical protein